MRKGNSRDPILPFSRFHREINVLGLPLFKPALLPGVHIDPKDSINDYSSPINKLESHIVSLSSE